MNTKEVARLAAVLIGLFTLMLLFFWGLAKIHTKVEMDSVLTTNGTTALMYAADHNDTSAVRNLLDNKAWVDGRNKQGDTALSLAALRGNNQVVRMLIDAGADLNTQNENGWTPIRRAKNAGNAATVRILLRAGATPEG